MPVLKTILPALLLGLAPASALAVSADTAVSLTWDGTYQTDLSADVGPSTFVDWTKNYVPYAKLHFSAETRCTDFDAADIYVWDAQYQGGITNYVAHQTGTSSTTTAVDASIAYDQFVYPGAAYLFSGYSHCDGAQPLTWDSDPYFSEVVNVPPAIARISIQSPQTMRYFNRLKAGATFKVGVEEYTPRDYSSATFDPRVFVVVEGAGIARTEYDITDRTKSDLTGIAPTQAGTLTLKLKVQNYLYFRDDWHNVNDTWDDYDWESKVPNPDFATTLYSTDRTCDYVFDGVPCANYGQPIFRAVPYTLESAPLQIPVEDSWCLVQDRADSSTHVIASEGCNSCSSHYNANANWWDDACSGESSNDDGDSGEKSSFLGCSAAGLGAALLWPVLALVPALRRRRR